MNVEDTATVRFWLLNSGLEHRPQHDEGRVHCQQGRQRKDGG